MGYSFYYTCIDCGFRSTRGVRPISSVEAEEAGKGDIPLPGRCKHRGACHKRQTAAFRLKRVEAGTYETPDRRYRIVNHMIPLTGQSVWVLFDQTPGERFFDRDERTRNREFDTLREAREWLEVMA